MSKIEILKSQIDICNIHTSRIEKALHHINHLLPFDPNKISKLSDEELSFLELLTSRFAKLQDNIGQKIFPLMLLSMQEDVQNKSFIDILNRLEKLEIIESSDYWIKMREIRNHIAHEYPDNPELMASNLNKVVEASVELLDFWERLQEGLNL